MIKIFSEGYEFTFDFPQNLLSSKSTVFEDEKIKAWTTGRDYDFILVIENKTGRDIELEFEGDLIKEEKIQISKNDWIGLLTNIETYAFIEDLYNKNFAYANE